MSWRAEVLAILHKGSVIRVARVLGVPIRPRQRKAVLVDQLARRDDIAPERFLQALSRDDLRKVCRELGLRVSGRKASLVERVIGHCAEQLVEAPPTSASAAEPGEGVALGLAHRV